jgi:hypothetical protein
MDENQLFTFQVADAGSGTQVDEVNCIVRGVSMITGGLIALGHDLEVDDTTLAQVFNCAAQLGQVPVKLDHGSGILNVNGHLTNFRKDGNKVRADWHLLEKHPNTPQMLEIAKKQPKTVGLSITFKGQPESKSGKKKARCTELVSTDLVPHPAANPGGMFSRGDVDSPGNHIMPGEAPPTNNAPATEGDKLDQILAAVQGIEKRLKVVEDFCQDVDEHLSGVDLEEPGAGAGAGEDPNGDGAEMGRRPQGEPDITSFMEQWFQGKLTELEAVEAERQLHTSLEALKGKQTQLVTALEESRAENTALHETIQELRAAGGGLKPVNSGSADTTMFSMNGAKNPHLTEFEQKVSETFTELSSKNTANAPVARLRTQALRQVMEAHPAVYEKHLAIKQGRTA